MMHTPDESSALTSLRRLADGLLDSAGWRRGAQLQSLNRKTLESLHGIRVNRQPFDRLPVSFAIAMKTISKAEGTRGAKAFESAVIAVTMIVLDAAVRSRSRRPTAQFMIAALTESIGRRPVWLREYIRNAPNIPNHSTISDLCGMTLEEWAVVVHDVNEEARYLRKPALDRLPAVPSASTGPSIADRLAAQSPDAIAQLETPLNYDTRDRSAKLLSVTVAGFRGSTSDTTVSLNRSDKPACVLLWGDNGSGKSTIIDGIEFALQGRIDRSRDFNSSLRPLASNLSSSSHTASVALDDGTCVARTLVQDTQGRYRASEDSVRPGFRIAPIVIRRADILRFLDTDTLSRGTIFFDYFPEPSGPLGARPDEHLSILDEERYSLRVLRADLATRLHRLYPGTEFSLMDRSNLDSFVRHTILQDARTERDETERWSQLDSSTANLITELRETMTRLRQISRELDRGFENLNPVTYRSQLDRVRPLLNSISSHLTASFIDITGATHVTSVQVMAGRSGPLSLDMIVSFTNGRSAFPQQVFSEAYKDLLALLFFLAASEAAAEHGQAKVLILDDVLQSVDSTVRVAAMRYILTRFRGWQIIVAGHDRSWMEQLRRLFSDNGVPFVERIVMHWTFDNGIIISGTAWSLVSSLQDAVSRHDLTGIASAAGLLLEQMSHELSWKLGTSVTRKQGDRYTLADLWPGIEKKLRRSPLAHLCSEITLRLPIRNFSGAHYNEWASEISASDLDTFGKDVLHLHDQLYCQKCSDFVTIHSGGSIAACKCGELIVRLNQGT